MIDKRVVIELAKSQIGYHEKATNAQLDDFYANAGSNNFTKYARDLDAIDGFYNYPGKNGYAWCDMFVDWCFIKAYGVTMGMQLLCQPWKSGGAGCQYSAAYYEQQGRFFVTGPQPGDQIFFDYGGGINHTGIVTEVNNYVVTTVEGNSDEQVQQSTYQLNASFIAGYGRPNWNIGGDSEPFEPEPEPAPEPEPEICELTVQLPIIHYGDESIWVKIMQALLISKGFSCGICGDDGEYGSDTKIGLYKFQQSNNLEADCVCNEQTWSLLLT